MRPGHGEVLIAEGDVETAEDRERLVQEFRRQLDQGQWAAVPLSGEEAVASEGRTRMVTSFDEIPRATDRVIFFPRAAGG
jgi:molybdopterin converting factor small subunit